MIVETNKEAFKKYQKVSIKGADIPKLRDAFLLIRDAQEGLTCKSYYFHQNIN